MTRVHSEIETELLSRNLQRDEQARRALSEKPSRWVGGLITAAVVVLIQVLTQVWRELPAQAGFALALLGGVVIGLGFELHLLQRKLNAVIRLTKLPPNGDA